MYNWLYLNGDIFVYDSMIKGSSLRQTLNKACNMITIANI